MKGEDKLGKGRRCGVGTARNSVQIRKLRNKEHLGDGMDERGEHGDELVAHDRVTVTILKGDEDASQARQLLRNRLENITNTM